MLRGYDERVFSTPDEQAAKAIILTPEAGLSTGERWRLETAWLKDRIEFGDGNGLVIDYGCGIGRMAKVLPNPVLGVDISMTMRRQAETYVSRTSFGAVSPEMFIALTQAGLQASGAMVIWVLQHVQNVKLAVYMLSQALPAGAPLWVMNRDHRIVPTAEGWQDDGVDVEGTLDSYFKLEEVISVPEDLCAAGATLARHIKK